MVYFPRQGFSAAVLDGKFWGHYGNQTTARQRFHQLPSPFVPSFPLRCPLLSMISDILGGIVGDSKASFAENHPMENSCGYGLEVRTAQECII